MVKSAGLQTNVSVCWFGACLLSLGILALSEVPAKAQVTSVSQLSDVQPTDWAYQALQSLVERYGVIAGYPDGTFRGNRPLSRYEFAAALNTVLNRIEELGGAATLLTQEDLQTLQRLQQDYQAALDQVRSRLDNIDTRLLALENTRFSATTQLDGEAIMALTGGSENSTLVSRVRLNLLSSWQNRHLLVTQLEAGNNGEDSVGLVHAEGENFLGTRGLLANGGGLDYVGADSGVQLNRLYYSFQPLENLAISVGPRMVPRDFIDRNRFANNEALDFNSSFFINNPLIVQNQIDRNPGAGIAVNWRLNNTPFAVNALYIASDADSPNRGWFGDRYQGSVEVEYTPNSPLALRLQYTRANLDQTEVNAFGVNAEWSFNRFFGAFGRFGIGSYEGYHRQLGRDLDLQPKSWAVGFSVRDFLIPGTAAGIALGQPFIERNLGNSTQTNFEVFYNLSLSDRLSITPSAILVNHADNQSQSGLTWQATLRTVILF
ncbi:MAG: iron uptake porin [Desertifilum sp. SIO1I2]|nr:iron uptake porin [Desertifilum sp. SIO1I2]